MQVSVPTYRLPRRRTRSARIRAAIPAVRRQQVPWRLIGAAALPVAGLAVLAYVARRRFYLGVALFAKAVEEAADAVEDAAEDLADAAQARAKLGETTE